MSLLCSCAALFVLECAGSIFTSFLVVNGDLAISQAPGCGIYKPPLGGPMIVNASRNIDQETEIDANQYAANCFDADNGADGCNFYSKQKIAIHEHHDQPCPFGADICPEDGTKGYSLETVIFSASDLGINAAETYSIKRTATCIPLNANKTFISEGHVDGVQMNKYFYGNYSDASGHYDYTWNTPVDNSSSQYTGYNVL